MQEVPIAITVVKAQDLSANAVVSVSDIRRFAPNVQTLSNGTTPGFPNFEIRGVGQNSSIRTLDPSVNIVQDGMTIMYGAGSIASTFDLESVEVLRGPQGVLFGRNATGGTIVLRTRRPSDHFEAHDDLTIGNYQTVNANGSVEGPPATNSVRTQR